MKTMTAGRFRADLFCVSSFLRFSSSLFLTHVDLHSPSFFFWCTQYVPWTCSWYNTLLAGLHADLFSRHASPLEVYGLVAVDERGEDVICDEICRQCNGKPQRRRVGRSVQLPDWFMNLHSSSRHFCTYTYVLYVRLHIFGEKNTKTNPEVRSRDGHVEYVCKISGYFLLKTAWTVGLLCGKHVYFMQLL